MADNARIALPETGTPVELDRIYQSLSDLTQALGPNGANKDGSLNTLLTAGAKALRATASSATRPCSTCPRPCRPSATTAGRCSTRCKNMSQLTDTLAANDQFVDGFMSDLTSVSTQLAADRGNLAKALAALARAVGTVRTFVHDNKGMVEKDVQELTRLLGVLARHKDDLNTLARIGALGLDNLTIAFDNKTNVDRVPPAGQPQRRQPRQHAVRHHLQLREVPRAPRRRPTTCELLRTIVKPFVDQIGADPSQNHSQPAQLKLGGSAPVTSLAGLLNALKAGNTVMSRIPPPPRTASPRRGGAAARHGPGRVRVQVRRCLRPAAARQQGRAPTTPTRSPPTSPTRSTWCPARPCSPTTCPSGRSPTSSGSAGTPASRSWCARTSTCPRTSRSTYARPACWARSTSPWSSPPPARRAPSDSPTATSSRCPAPAATRRSRRCSAPCRWCSAAVASVSSRRSATS